MVFVIGNVSQALWKKAFESELCLSLENAVLRNEEVVQWSGTNNAHTMTSVLGGSERQIPRGHGIDPPFIQAVAPLV